METKTPTPSAEAMECAAAWLECYEADDTGECGTEDRDWCHLVAKWLREKADQSDFRIACKQAGVSVKKARAALAKARGE